MSAPLSFVGVRRHPTHSTVSSKIQNTASCRDLLGGAECRRRDSKARGVKGHRCRPRRRSPDQRLLIILIGTPTSSPDQAWSAVAAFDPSRRASAMHAMSASDSPNFAPAGCSDAAMRASASVNASIATCCTSGSMISSTPARSGRARSPPPTDSRRMQPRPRRSGRRPFRRPARQTARRARPTRTARTPALMTRRRSPDRSPTERSPADRLSAALSCSSFHR